MKICEDLRRAVLQAAIQGKLTEQKAEDGTAEDLLKEIRKEKEKLIAEGKIKREKVLSPIKDDEKPFDIPDNWVWCNVQKIFFVHSSLRIHKTDWKNEGIPFFRGRELVRLAKTGEPNAEIFISIELYNKNKERGGVPQKGDILISAVGTLGKVYVVKGIKPFYYKDAYILCLDNFAKICPEYARYTFESPFMQAAIKNDSMATTVAQLTIEKLKSLSFPLPPIAEQHRIVERVDALMSKIDELEKIENELEAMKKKFPGDLRDALLQAAIQGKLTEQRAEDGTAEDLLKEIRKEKARLIADGKIKQEKALPPIKDDEIPFEIPDNWVWVRLGEIGKWQSGSTPPKTRPEFYGGNIPWLITGDLNDDYIDDENIPNRITELALSETSVKMNPKGSVLIAMYGATIGKTGILNIDATTNQACCACLAFRGIFNEYLFWILRALKQTFISMGEGGAQPNISKEKIVKTIFPLPPLAEQHRIVERLNELLPLCETMKGQEE